nr:relaxase/mobilization nuclease domain-containing protein [Vibrio sp. 10N.286.48.B7]PMH80519.1 hypothetical protein BCU58_03640 [Vibrio sp. 10N.286.48.B7]
MLHKVIGKTEKSKAKGPTGAINYLSGYSWRHTEPQVLRGNLEVTRELLSHEDKDPYTHGVLSYEENALDVPQDEQDFAMNLIEETLMAGFPPEHYDIVWIRHDDKDYDTERGSGRIELNYHIVNRDLITGKKISPYVHKYDLHRVNLAKQIINDKFGYSSPDDPARARQINLEGYGSENKGAAKKLNDFILNGIQTEQIDSRDDIIKALQSRDDVEHVEPNKADTFLVLKMKGAKRNLRLKGTLYGKQFTSVERLLATTQDDSRQYHRASEQRLADNIQELQRLNTTRAEKRQRLIEPIRKRGRKPKAVEPVSTGTNPEERQQLDSGHDQPSHQIDQGTDKRNQPSQGTEQPNARRDAASPDRPEQVHGQVPTNSSDHSSDKPSGRDNNWNTFTVLTFKPKTKIKEHDSKENTNTTSETLVRTRATIEAGQSTNGRDSEPERHQLGVDLGSIQRAAIYARDFITRIIQAVRDNHSAVRSNQEIVGSELENGRRIEAGEGIKGDVRADYDELNAKCRHLDRLLRGTDPIGLTLTMEQGRKADPTPSVRSTPRPRFR